VTTLLEQAIALSTKYHAGQKRKWGDPPADYLTHPLAVALMVAQYDNDPLLMAAAVCHDLREDTACSDPEIERAVGEYPLLLVRNLTDVEDKRMPRAERKALNRKRLSSCCDATLLIKACDRLHNLMTLDDASEDFRQVYMEESRLLVEEVLAGSIPLRLLGRLREMLK
jgi:GTP pyrophosphokinase